MLCAERQPSGEDRARVTGATLTTSMSSRILIQANPSISLLPHLGPSLQWQSADTKWKTAAFRSHAAEDSVSTVTVLSLTQILLTFPFSPSSMSQTER